MAIKHQGRLISMVKFREILRLHNLGYNQSEIARSCLIARSTVQVSFVLLADFGIENSNIIVLLRQIHN